jgi:hypothetical protein
MADGSNCEVDIFARGDLLKPIAVPVYNRK